MTETQTYVDMLRQTSNPLKEKTLKLIAARLEKLDKILRILLDEREMLYIQRREGGSQHPPL